MGATTTYALPYPELTDPADVPTDMHELADAVDSHLGTVDGKVAAEATARQNADTAEATARQNADTTETTARTNADNALDGRVTTNTTALATETTNRTNADTALGGRIDKEINDRGVAVGQEQAARQTADQNEQSARQTADGNLSNRATALEARNKAIGGVSNVAFNAGSGRVNFPSQVASVLAVSVNGNDGATWNVTFGVNGMDVNGFGVTAWSIDNTALTNPAVRVVWTAIVT